MRADSMKIAVGMGLFAMLVGFAPAHARSRSCSQESAAGTYGYTNSGSIPALGVFAFVSVGQATLDAAGTISGNQTTPSAGIEPLFVYP